MNLGRNDPCSCGSGKKYKHCCLGKEATHAPASAPTTAELNQLATIFNSGQHTELASRAHALLEQYPDSLYIWTLLGISQRELGRLAESEASYRRALEIKPDYPEVLSNLGNTLREQGRLIEAEASYRRALEIKPDYVMALSNLGATLQNLGRLAEASVSYKRALEIKPDHPEAHNNLGIVLKEQGRLTEAETSYRRALEIKNDYSDAHCNLGSTLREQGRLVEAVECYQRALKIKPDLAEANTNLSAILQEQGRFTEAEAGNRLALEFKPDLVEAHLNLGNVLREQGRLIEAEVSYRRALKLKPDYVDAYSCLLVTLNTSADYQVETSLIVAGEYGRMVAKKVKAKFNKWQCVERFERIRVGVVSGDLRSHPVGFFLERVLSQLDAGRIELIAYPTDSKADQLTARIKPYFSAWKLLFGLSDEAAARLIHADGVHVLLDLSGHTAKNRLPIFAWKPAPVQASWLGYFASTGVAEMDYLLADKVGVPEDQRSQFTENVWYLPDTRLCFTPPVNDLLVTPLPALHNGYVTFGCFQNMAKVGEEVLAAWANILNAVPNAKLRWQSKQLRDETLVAQLKQRLQRHNIDLTRVTLYGPAPRNEYLGAHAAVDLILDTFPYPGGTTTCEALWMGVPTLTLAGDTLLARQGASLLTAAGLEDWVATSATDYVDKAITLSGDLNNLAALRGRLREQVSTSPLFDAPRFARNLEDALWGMWQSRDSETIK